MNTKKPICRAGLKKNIIKKEIFEREAALCKNLAKENGGKCNWGVCDKCGVLPLLYKLHKGVLLEKPEELKEIRK
ncbi:MAG: hypothetical protein ACWGHO_02910 [Candidatus Moraniibacteriota bacterium]